MNINKEYLGYALIWLGGAAAGSLATKLVIEKKLQADLAFQAETFKNTYDAAVVLHEERLRLLAEAKIDTDAVVLHGEGRIGTVDAVRETESGIEADLIFSDVPIKDYVGEVVETRTNPYHTAVVASMSDNAIVVNPDADFGVSYIEPEDYQEEDGRLKAQIDIMMHDQEPIFVMDGSQIDDWDRRVGDSILVDMYSKCPPGTESILYVRNHRTDEDYEVVLVTQP